MNISIIGGDLRIVKLANMLSDDGNNILTYGLEKSNDMQITKSKTPGCSLPS